MSDYNMTQSIINAAHHEARRLETISQQKRFKAFMQWAQTYKNDSITMTSPCEKLGGLEIPDFESLVKAFLTQENYYEGIV